MQPVPTYILAGGKSSRFRSDKARAELHGEPLLTRIARALTPRAASISVVADVENKYADLGLRSIADERPGVGPMAGLQRAIKDLAAPGWLHLVSCDFVKVDVAWLESLLKSTTGDPGLAIVFEGPSHIEPLFALYHSNIARHVEFSLARRNYSLTQMIDRVPHTLVPLPGNWGELAHINTREELERARRKLT